MGAARTSLDDSVQPERNDLIALNQIPRAEPSARPPARWVWGPGTFAQVLAIWLNVGQIFGKDLGQKAFLGRKQTNKKI